MPEKFAGTEFSCDALDRELADTDTDTAELYESPSDYTCVAYCPPVL